MPRVYDAHEALIEDVLAKCRELLAQRDRVLVSIDGLGGSGKTALAASISASLSAAIISLDEYLTPNEGTYLQHLHYPEIETALRNAELSDVPLIVVEGLCVHSALSRLARQPDILIYIRRIGQYGEWLDEFWYSEDNNLEEVLDSLSDIEARHPDTPGIADSDRELVRYHIETRPISNAHFLYNRRVQPPVTDDASA